MFKMIIDQYTNGSCVVRGCGQYSSCAPHRTTATAAYSRNFLSAIMLFFLSFFIRDTAVDAVSGMNANRRWLKNWKFYHRELNLFVPIQSDHFLPRPFFSLLSEEWSIYFIYFFSSILIWRAIKWWWFWCSGKAAAEADRFQHYILYIFQWPIRPDIMVIMMRLPGIPFSVPIVSILYILYRFYIYR